MTDQPTHDRDRQDAAWMGVVLGSGCEGGMLVQTKDIYRARLRRIADRFEAVLDENERLREELVELLGDLFYEIATKMEEGDKTGWYCSNARGTAVYAGDRLVELGVFEKHDDGYGRVQFYRPKEAAK